MKHRLKRISVSSGPTSNGGPRTVNSASSNSNLNGVTARREKIAASLRNTRDSYPMVKLDESFRLEYVAS